MRNLFVRRAAPLVLLAALTACDVPNFEGPQVQTPPPAFFLQNEATQQRTMFDHLESVYFDAWVETSDGFFSGIFINGHSGVLTADDVFAAQDSARLYADDLVRFGEVESLSIDGRTAWAWAEIRQGPQIGVDWIAYRAMIPYDTITYAVEFHGGEPGLKVKPDTLRTIVASFAIGKTTWNLPLIAILGGSLLLGVSILRSRAAERRRRLQSIALKTIPKKDDEESEDATVAFTPGGLAAAVAQAADPGAAPPAGPTGGAPPAQPAERPSTASQSDGAAEATSRKPEPPAPSGPNATPEPGSETGGP